MADSVPPPSSDLQPGSSRKGTLFAVIALGFVLVMVIFFPAARIFLAISIPIGIVCAVILYFVNRRPVKLPDEENKRPLGLS
jgi:asparagine N-glycosylation enzyme membrane subunit Stt3